MSTGVRMVALGCGAGIAGFLALFVWSWLEMGLAAGLGALVETRWGVTTLVDLYAGLIVIGAWIAALERRPGRVAAWWIALALLGNFTAIVYLLTRCFRVGSVRALLLGASNAPGAPRSAGA